MEMLSTMLMKSLRDESAHLEPLELFVVAGVLLMHYLLIHLLCHFCIDRW